MTTGEVLQTLIDVTYGKLRLLINAIDATMRQQLYGVDSRYEIVDTNFNGLSIAIVLRLKHPAVKPKFKVGWVESNSQNNEIIRENIFDDRIIIDSIYPPNPTTRW